MTAAEGSAITYRAETWTRARRDRDGIRVPSRPATVLRSATVRTVRPDGVVDVMTGNGLAFVSPLAIVKVTPPKDAS